jgi:hypothetical protein
VKNSLSGMKKSLSGARKSLSGMKKSLSGIKNSLSGMKKITQCTVWKIDKKTAFYPKSVKVIFSPNYFIFPL